MCIFRRNTSEDLPMSVLEAWSSLPNEVRAALVKKEVSARMDTSQTIASSLTKDSVHSATSSNASSNEIEEKQLIEECPESGGKVVLTPLERAPKNVFAFEKTLTNKWETVMFIFLPWTIKSSIADSLQWNAV